METMFSGATSFNQDLTQWCVSNMGDLSLIIDTRIYEPFRFGGAFSFITFTSSQFLVIWCKCL
jgi:hypothetical protein